MQLTVTGKQLDIGDALRSHVADSLEDILGKYFGSAIDATVIMTRDAHLYDAQLSVHIGRGILLQSAGAATAPYLAFDEAAGRLATRLRRYKRRLRDHHRAAVESERANQYVLAPESDEEPTTAGTADGDGSAHATETDAPPLIVAEMQTDLPVLTVREAVMRLDLADLTAMLFRNRAHGGLNLVYRRPDGNFGWVDPASDRRN
ncbi:MAG: ribosome-associated translation inhibitor RaiA [Dongiaceae bacterium]